MTKKFVRDNKDCEHQFEVPHYDSSAMVSCGTCPSCRAKRKEREVEEMEREEQKKLIFVEEKRYVEDGIDCVDMKVVHEKE